MDDNNSNVAVLQPAEPRPLMWKDREVEPRDISVKIQREANNHARSGDNDAMLFHILAHSLVYKDDGKRVFKSVDQIREDTAQRDYYKLMTLAVACVRHNSPDEKDIPPDLRAQIDANVPK